MKRSTDRILVTHVGSLVRPMSIRNILSARDYGEAVRRGRVRADAAGGGRRRRAQAGGCRHRHRQRRRIRQGGLDPLCRRAARRLRPSRDPHRRPRAQPGPPDPRGEEISGILRRLYADPVSTTGCRPEQSKTPLKADPRRCATTSWSGNASPRSPTRVRPRSARHRQLQGGARGVEGRRALHAGGGADERARAVAQRLLQDRRRRSSSRSQMR